MCVGLLSRSRSTVSIITMAPSTRMPKSMAPSDSRLAGTPLTFISTKAMSSASGMVMATMRAPRRLRRKSISTTMTSSMPTSRVCDTVFKVSPTKLVLSMNGRMRTPSGNTSLFSSSTAMWMASSTSEGFSPRSICTMPSTASS